MQNFQFRWNFVYSKDLRLYKIAVFLHHGKSHALNIRSDSTLQNLAREKLFLTYSNNLFVKSKNEFSNSPIHEFKVLQNVFKIKKQGLKCITNTPLKGVLKGSLAYM